ncbi:MAG: ribose 5-phosphate isomerase B [Candidatus Melainabacteria bacterium]|nr:MAG: ribose 5-phosphate isomerase B [Candidatus Melainabacteria bacterium]
MTFASRIKETSGKIAVGSDHAGFDLKEKIKKLLTGKSIDFIDFGTFSLDSCDYPDYARKAANAVASGEAICGILCCGSGVGISIVANKVRGIRAALLHEPETAALCRQHNDANMLCMAGRTMDEALLEPTIEAFLITEFEGGRHARRVDKIEEPRKGEQAGNWSK